MFLKVIAFLLSVKTGCDMQPCQNNGICFDFSFADPDNTIHAMPGPMEDDAANHDWEENYMPPVRHQ